MKSIQEVKDIPTIDVATRYGIQTNRSGFCKCFVHSDKNPSMKIYKDHFYCFACGVSGDNIALVQCLFSLDFKEALEKLENDFGIKSHVLTNKQKQAQSVIKAEADYWEEVKKKAYRYLVDYLHILAEWRPAVILDETDQIKLEYSLLYYDYTSYVIDCFLDDPDNTLDRLIASGQMTFIKNFVKSFKEEKTHEHQLSTLSLLGK